MISYNPPSLDLFSLTQNITNEESRRTILDHMDYESSSDLLCHNEVIQADHEIDCILKIPSFI